MIEWTSLNSVKPHKRLHNAVWCMEQMELLLELMREGKTRLADEGYLYIGNHDNMVRGITMSGWVGIPETVGGVMGAKWVSSCPANRAASLPRGASVTMLNDGETGLPLLAFNGTSLSNARTALFAIMAITRKWPIGRRCPGSILFIGAGRVHMWQAFYLKQLWPDLNMYVFDPAPHPARLFSEQFNATEVTATTLEVTNIIGLETDIVSVATAGARDGWIGTNFQRPMMCINTSLRDVTPEYIDGFDEVIVDDTTLALGQPDVPFHKSFRGGAVYPVLMLCNVDEIISEFTFVNPMGCAIWDVGLGYALLKEEFDEQRYLTLHALE